MTTEKPPPASISRISTVGWCRGPAPNLLVRWTRRYRRTELQVATEPVATSGGPRIAIASVPAVATAHDKGQRCSGARSAVNADHRTARTPRCRLAQLASRLRIRWIDVCPAPKNRSARNGNMFSWPQHPSLSAPSVRRPGRQSPRRTDTALPAERWMHHRGLHARPAVRAARTLRPSLEYR